uniref:DUF4912 domain-containing protein n=1 Tax=Oscillatoriales cyanobacterium SpSt-418 TaxID=2282169 RepID=A0A7C3KHN4_9CYAN
MINLLRKKASFASLSVLIAVSAIAAKPLAETIKIQPAFAQAAAKTYQAPASLPDNTSLRVDGAAGMAKITEAITSQLQTQYKGLKVDQTFNGTDAALKALNEGKVDIAAIGRPLTAAEKQQGFVEVPVSRNKIALIVSSNSPFKGDVTIDQFARIAEGKITNWSQVDPQVSGPVRLVDRPVNSDIRQSFGQYPAFQTGTLPSTSVKQVGADNTDAVIKALGEDGVGYAIADQVANRKDVRILSMYGTLPTDPKYPFSQPLVYAYKGQPSPAVQAFLGYATQSGAQAAIEKARVTDVTQAIAPIAQAPASPAPADPGAPTDPAPEISATEDQPATAAEGGLPGWLLPLLGIPLLGLLLWWLFRGGGSVAPVVAPVAAGAASRMILTPRNCRDAYAYWEVSDEVFRELKRQGGRDLKVRLYDVTDIDMARQRPHSTREFDCSDREPDLHIPIPVDNRDYLAELGYVTKEGEWLSICQSESVRVPACDPIGDIDRTDVATGLGVAGAAAAGAATFGTRPQVAVDREFSPMTDSRIILVPRDATSAYAYWEISELQKNALKQAGGRDLRLRLYDVTGNIDVDRQAPHSVQEYDCNEIDPDMHLTINDSDRDYLVELGYITEQGRWLKLARSEAVRVPAASSLGQYN